jgi:hypothetical protein
MFCVPPQLDLKLIETVPPQLQSLSLGQRLLKKREVLLSSLPMMTIFAQWPLNNHFFINSNVPADAPLFAFETPDHGWSMMLKHHFMDECRLIWSQEGLQLVGRHSF